MASLDINGRPLFLVGFMGCGKSTAGQLLAARLGRPFVDLDARIESEAGATIPELFATEGETGFRAREADWVVRMAHAGAQVIAVGGGAPCFGGNMDQMLGAGVVVGLVARVDHLLARIGDGVGRPLLAGVQDRRAEVERLLALREPHYARAHLTVDTTELPPSQVVAKILAGLAGP